MAEKSLKEKTARGLMWSSVSNGAQLFLGTLFGIFLARMLSPSDYGMVGLLQVFTLDGWAEDIARPVMAVFPHSWLFFAAFLLFSFLLMISFVMSVFDEIVHRELLKEVAPECRLPEVMPAGKKDPSVKKEKPKLRKKVPAMQHKPIK